MASSCQNDYCIFSTLLKGRAQLNNTTFNLFNFICNQWKDYLSTDDDMKSYVNDAVKEILDATSSPIRESGALQEFHTAA